MFYREESFAKQSRYELYWDSLSIIKRLACHAFFGQHITDRTRVNSFKLQEGESASFVHLLYRHTRIKGSEEEELAVVLIFKYLD